MVGYITKLAGGDFTPTPEGVHLMVCSQVVDLGTQPGSQQFPEPKRKVMIRWELPEERVTIDGQSKPVLHSETYTWSFHEKANLRKMLEAWRGRKFSEEDFAGPPDGFHIGKLLGVPMRGNIVHEAQGDKTYANLASVMPAGIKRREDVPKVEGDSFVFDLDAFDAAIFARLSDFWQGKVKASPEYLKATGKASPEYLKATGNGQAPGASGNGQGPGSDLDDDIPL